MTRFHRPHIDPGDAGERIEAGSRPLGRVELRLAILEGAVIGLAVIVAGLLVVATWLWAMIAEGA